MQALPVEVWGNKVEIAADVNNIVSINKDGFVKSIKAVILRSLRRRIWLKFAH